MNSTPTIFLEENVLYDLGGKKYTLKELREHAIDSKILKELKGDVEWITVHLLILSMKWTILMNAHSFSSVKNAVGIVEMMIMINQIIKFHSGLEKGETIKVITALDNYVTYISRTDLLKKVDDEVLCIFRANDAKVALNCNYVVSCCVIKGL